MQGSIFFSLLLVVAVVVTDVTGDKPDTGDPGDLDNDDMVGVRGGGEGGQVRGDVGTDITGGRGECEVIKRMLAQ